MDKLRRVPAWGWALLFSILLCLPRVGAFGLWEPWELNLADRARRTADAGLTFGGIAEAFAAGNLGTIFTALGIKFFGPTEFGARVFDALFGVGALMAVYWAGVGLFRKRAALLAVLVLGTMPLFALSARQVTSDMLLVASLAVAIGGLGRWFWPADGTRRPADGVIGLGGLALGFGAGGALLGVALPALAVVLAVAVCFSLLTPGATGKTSAGPRESAHADSVDDNDSVGDSDSVGDNDSVGDGDSLGEPNDGTAALTARGVGPHVPAGRTFGASIRGHRAVTLALAALAACAVGIVVAAFTTLVAGHRSAFLGGTPRAGVPSITFDYLVRQLGFGLFPWSAVAFFALGRPLIRLDGDEDANGRPLRTNARLAFVQIFLLLFAGLGLALSTYVALVVGEARYVALAAIALAVGSFLDEALEGNRSEPVAGLLIATGTMIVARDFFLQPEELASVHLLGERVKWPAALSIGYLVMGFGLVVALGIYTGLATRGKALGKVPGRDLTGARAWQRKLESKIVEAGRFGLQVAVGAAVVFAFWLTQRVVPGLSAHFSFKPMIDTYGKYAKHGEKFARYHVEGKGTSFYSGLTMTELATQDNVIAFLRDPARVFALVSADELASLDAAMKTARIPYFTVDGTSSRFLLLSNKLEAGERDQNPLKANVWMAPTPPAPNGGQWNASETPPWKWRVPLAATFADAIEIVGAEYPEAVRRPAKIQLELFFRVKVRPPAGFKIFVHFDGPATPRVIGDHDPVGKAFPTAHWLPGEYIRDLYEVDVPLMTTPAGTYQIFMGFWPGGDGRRLKITQGPNDGSDRLRVGSIDIK